MIFELSWSWYEDYQHWLLEHPHKTNKQFKEDVKKALKEVGEEYIKKEDSWVGASRWMEFAFKKLIKDYGYNKPEVGDFTFFGGYILDESPRNDEVKRWAEIVGKDLINMALKKNKTIEKK